MTKDPACGNGPALPDLRMMHINALHLLEAFELLDAIQDVWPSRQPITPICIAFKSIAKDLADSLEKMADAQDKKEAGQ
ncbi:hypothetical protein [Mesobacterium pallidum]|uniref:hypothetical protein n=1 Tax=Mesobacterium pallidum TaxID=2872037 RepID=UPI001EE1E69F|nr:hypothetical protein [Mesobacterium pallidum]